MPVESKAMTYKPKASSNTGLKIAVGPCRGFCKIHHKESLDLAQNEFLMSDFQSPGHVPLLNPSTIFAICKLYSLWNNKTSFIFKIIPLLFSKLFIYCSFNFYFIFILYHPNMEGTTAENRFIFWNYLKRSTKTGNRDIQFRINLTQIFKWYNQKG